MPIYAYRCQDPEKGCAHCRNGFDELQRISAVPLRECPECHHPVVRLINAAATIEQRTTSQILSDDNLKKHGFKKMVNRGGGRFDEAV